MKICKQKLLLVKEDEFEYNQKFKNSKDVIKFISKITKINNEPQEVVYLLTVDVKNHINGFTEIARRRNKLVQSLIM